MVRRVKLREQELLAKAMGIPNLMIKQINTCIV
jgi:hypothetical protein